MFPLSTAPTEWLQVAPHHIDAFFASPELAGVSPPSCMVPEMEVFCGEVPVAPYGTPGSIEMSRTVAALVGRHNTILMRIYVWRCRTRAIRRSSLLEKSRLPEPQRL